MRKQLLLILTLSLILAVTACRTYSGGGSEVDENGKATFQATILEVRDGYYLVEPVDGSTELNSADQITVPITNINPSPEPEVGDVLEISEHRGAGFVINNDFSILKAIEDVIKLYEDVQ